METIFDRAERIAVQIRLRIGDKTPSIGLILGSGWGGAAGLFADADCIPYRDLSGMPRCGVEGHAGEMVVGRVGNTDAVIFRGRFHLYEGRGCDEVVLPVAVLHALGIRKLLLTNSAGGVNSSFSVGDMMVITDHINMTGLNPLLGIKARANYPIFVDMSDVYDAALSEILRESLLSADLQVRSGVYMQLTGPSYETGAEVRAYRTLGVDAVGMSTAIEAIYGHYLGMRLAAVSCITNLAAGMGGKVSHEEVLEQTSMRESKLTRAMLYFVEKSSAL